MLTRRHICLLAAGLAFATSSCRVWTDFEASNASSDPDACGFLCEPVPWWNDDYGYRLSLQSTARFDGAATVVLPASVPGSDLPGDQVRDDLDDLRVVLNGAEVEREAYRLADNTVVVWARFPRVPRHTDAVYLYWGFSEATVPQLPWDGHIGAFHLDEDFQNSVPGAEEGRIQAINDPSNTELGRLGGGASVPPWPGSLRLYNTEVLENGAMSVAFSFRGREALEGAGGRTIHRIIRSESAPCTPLELSRSPTGKAVLVWTDFTTCSGEDDPTQTAEVAVNLTDGAWHDVVIAVDLAESLMTLTVDDAHASASITGGGPISGRADLSGGTSDDPPGQFVFDEFRISDEAVGADEARFLNRAVRGEAWTIGGVEKR